MNWLRLQNKHIHNDPVPHIHAINLLEEKEYDKLYENQNDLNHQLWQDFDEKYKIGFEFKEDISEIDLNREIIAIWCFRERNDRTRPPHFVLAGKKIAYYPNALIITNSNDITIDDSKVKKYIRRPFIQLDINKKKFKELMARKK
tara:strand:+ start:56 stop:490 length:435 start_codon:yes stop_codon:yes gene_type:complete